MLYRSASWSSVYYRGPYQENSKGGPNRNDHNTQPDIGQGRREENQSKYTSDLNAYFQQGDHGDMKLECIHC